jgi:hypothetical protein
MSVLNQSCEEESLRAFGSSSKTCPAKDFDSDLNSAPTLQLAPVSMPEIVFLYRLVPGRTTESHGFRCALSAGVPFEVIERAKVLLFEFYT